MYHLHEDCPWHLPQLGVEHHECPYKHHGDSNFSAPLEKLKIGNVRDMDMIMFHKKDGNLQLVCGKNYGAMHLTATSVDGVNLDGIGNI